MIDFVGFLQQNGVLWSIALLALLSLCGFVWREFKRIHGNYTKTLCRVEVVEKSIRDPNTGFIISRKELLDKVKELEIQVEMTKKVQEDLIREFASMSSSHLLLINKEKTSERKN